MKRFLSLVLALVMTMSLVTISAGAKDFTDAEAINYAEAIDVVSAVGIIDGYTDGSFNPRGGLTRGAAAKIICNLILGPTTAENLIADAAPYSDVPTSNVFAGYIAYCQKEGIISGYADGTFKPAASLTGFAFMKMLLGALGYDAKIEGYTGNNWSINVAKQALAIGLEESLDGTFNGNKALTREEACLYAFNTLKATMVEYDETTNIVIGDIQISTTSNEKAVPNTKYSYDKSLRAGTGAGQDSTMEFCEKYFEDLKLEATGNVDGFQRPANYWTLEGEDIGKYASAPAQKDVSRGDNDVSTILFSSSYMDYDSADVTATTVAINGVAGQPLTTKIPKGAVVETYENEQGKVTDVVAYWYTYAKIDAIETDLTADDKKQGATAILSLVGIDGKTAVGNGDYYDAYENGSKPVLSGYTDKYVEDTVLAVCIGSNDVIADSYIPASYTGVPTAAQALSAKEGYMTVGGNKYEYAGTATVGVPGTVDFESEYTVYVSAEGYAFAVEGKGALVVDDLYYITGVYSGSSKGATVYTAQAVSLAYSTEKEFVLEADDALALAYSGTGFDSSMKGLYSLSDKNATTPLARGNNNKWNTERYDHTAPNSKYDMDTGVLSADVKSDAFKVDYTGGTNAKSYITDNTVFISIDGDSASLKSKYGKGSMQMASGTNVIILEEKDSNEAVLVIYVGSNLQGVIDTEDVVYLSGTPLVSVSAGYQVTLRYMKDMSSKTVILDSKNYSRGFYTYSTNDDGTVTLNGLDALDKNGAVTIDTNDDMTTGYALDVQLTSQKNQYLTGANSLTSGVTFEDVKFSGATVIDTRNSGDRDAQPYKPEVKSVSGLAAAIDKKGADPVVDVYVVDGEIVFACVHVVGGDLINIADVDLPTYDYPMAFYDTRYGQGTVELYLRLDNNNGATINTSAYHFYLVNDAGRVMNSQTTVSKSETMANGAHTSGMFGRKCLTLLADANGKYPAGDYKVYAWYDGTDGKTYGWNGEISLKSDGTSIDKNAPQAWPDSVDVTLPVGTYPSTAYKKGAGWRTNSGNGNATYITLGNDTGATITFDKFAIYILDANGDPFVSKPLTATTSSSNTLSTSGNYAVTTWAIGKAFSAFAPGDYTVYSWGIATDGKTYGNLGFTITIPDPSAHVCTFDTTTWASDTTNHWHPCTDSSCNLKQDEAAHIPGPAATATEPQKCTVCERVLAPATGGPARPAGVPASYDVTLEAGEYANAAPNGKGLGWRIGDSDGKLYIMVKNPTGTATGGTHYNVFITDSTGNQLVGRTAVPSSGANIAAGKVASWASGAVAATTFPAGDYNVYVWCYDGNGNTAGADFTITIPGASSHTHTYNNNTASATQASPATCTEAAKYYVKCDGCEEVGTATVSVGTAAGHSFTTKDSGTQAAPATCTEAAKNYVQCDNCDEVSATETVSVGTAAGHSFTTKASATQAAPATCTEAAKYFVQCDNCDEVSATETVSVGDPAHSPASAWTYDVKNGHWHACTADGCTVKLDQAAHTLSADGKCACGFEVPDFTTELAKRKVSSTSGAEGWRVSTGDGNFYVDTKNGATAFTAAAYHVMVIEKATGKAVLANTYKASQSVAANANKSMNAGKAEGKVLPNTEYTVYAWLVDEDPATKVWGLTFDIKTGETITGVGTTIVAPAPSARPEGVPESFTYALTQRKVSVADSTQSWKVSTDLKYFYAYYTNGGDAFDATGLKAMVVEKATGTVVTSNSGTKVQTIAAGYNYVLNCGKPDNIKANTDYTVYAWYYNDTETLGMTFDITTGDPITALGTTHN